jgi:hypothetical protein
MVVENIGAEALRRAVGAGHGGHRPVLRRMAALSLSFIRKRVHRPFSNLRVGLEDTPSWGKVVIEPLRYSLLEPVVLGVILEVRFSVLKTYFFSVNQKYVF